MHFVASVQLGGPGPEQMFWQSKRKPGTILPRFGCTGGEQNEASGGQRIAQAVCKLLDASAGGELERHRALCSQNSVGTLG